MEMICAFKLLPFLSWIGRPIENREMIEVNVAHDQHTIAGSASSMSMHPGNHKTRAWQKSNSDAAACIVANGERRIPSVLHVSHRTLPSYGLERRKEKCLARKSHLASSAEHILNVRLTPAGV
ncbi:hypothetical protein [Bradyrhizobium sp. 76]|uniref:hypothetical protein n=1 Tax=Bradyrhizobium sp. 76 TaxID=2782680 RepID=UPI001FFC0F40|nr:hypothetical protein [Bradyrhizobium sp. 76]MCK1408212.1 hypothetical protein [Bradyrhizobium sp. 76]